VIELDRLQIVVLKSRCSTGTSRTLEPVGARG
jgi:hypothetical protein